MPTNVLVMSCGCGRPCCDCADPEVCSADLTTAWCAEPAEPQTRSFDGDGLRALLRRGLFVKRGPDGVNRLLPHRPLAHTPADSGVLSGYAPPW